MDQGPGEIDDLGPDTTDAKAYARDFTGNRSSYPKPGGGTYGDADVPDVIMQGYATRNC